MTFNLFKKNAQKTEERERLDQAESDFSFRFGYLSSQDDWEWARAKFPLCPQCESNATVRYISHGRKGMPEKWLHDYCSVRGSCVGSPERWTCTAHGDFFGHKAKQPGGD